MQSPAPSPDDVALLLAVAQRDERAFAELYDRMSGPLLGMVLRIIRERAEAEEILQDAFWKIWESAASYQPALGSPFSWMVTITRRKAIDRHRANARHLSRITGAHAELGDENYALPTGLADLAAGESRVNVRVALAKLGAEERQAILLAFFDGLTHLEIASAMNEPVGTIKSRIRRGLSKLKIPLSDPTLACNN